MNRFFNWLPWRVLYRRQRRLFSEYGDRIISAMIRQTMDTREWEGGELDRIREAVTAIHPAHIDMTQELADAILDCMRGPLTISQEASDWLRDSTGDYQEFISSPLGYRSGGTVYTTITPDGTINLEFRNQTGETFWRGEFTPPGYRKALPKGIDNE